LNLNMEKRMARLATLALASLLVSPTAAASDIERWEGAYNMAGNTIKKGERIGIGGAIASAVGLGALISGGFAYALDSGDAHGPWGPLAARVGLGGVVIGGASLLFVGPAMIASGSIRQARVVQQVNPNAPPPSYGYTTWGLIAATMVAAPIATPLAYATGMAQKRQNRLYWEQATSMGPTPSGQPAFTVELAPLQYNGAKGLALVGTF
jgi:hypothetical protein